MRSLSKQGTIFGVSLFLLLIISPLALRADVLSGEESFDGEPVICSEILPPDGEIRVNPKTGEVTITKGGARLDGKISFFGVNGVDLHFDAQNGLPAMSGQRENGLEIKSIVVDGYIFQGDKIYTTDGKGLKEISEEEIPEDLRKTILTGRNLMRALLIYPWLSICEKGRMLSEESTAELA